MPSSHLDYTKALCSIVYTSSTVINLQPQHTSLIGSNHLLSMCTGSQTDTRGWQYGDKQTGSPQRTKPPIWQWHFSLEDQLPLRLTASGCQSHSHEREIEQWSDTTQPLLYSCERKDIISQQLLDCSFSIRSVCVVMMTDDIKQWSCSTACLWWSN